MTRPTVFRDENILSSDFVPEDLPHRTPELQGLARLFISFLRSPGTASRNVIITGPVGSGKTALVKRFASLLHDSCRERSINLKPFHVNCRKTRTPFMVLNTVLRSFDPAIPKKGIFKKNASEELKPIDFGRKMRGSQQ